MNAIGEQSLPWFAAERVAAQPDLAMLVRDHSPLLYRIALSLVRNPAEAEDVVQDVFLRVIERSHQLAGIAEIKPWLIRITWNLALDRLRRIRPEQMDDACAGALLSAAAQPDQALSEAARIHQVLAAIDKLPNLERQALLLSAMHELTTAEIAAAMHRNESSIRSLIFRARAHLRQRLKEWS